MRVILLAVVLGAAGLAQSPATISLDLAGALQRARDYNQAFLQAGITAASAHEDRVQAKAAMLPSLNFLNQYIYTQGNETPSGVFVANDGVHIYNEQAAVHAEPWSPLLRAEYRRAIAAEAVAKARRDIAARGLVTTVVQNYYGLITAQRHLRNAEQSVAEARSFVDITQKQERGGEVARADVIKARLQLQQRERDLMDARATVEKARVALGVIVFPNLDQQFTVADDLGASLTLPPVSEYRPVAISTSPDIMAAQSGLTVASAGTSAARAGYYPVFAIDYFYGINANVLAFRGPDNRQNLGSMVQGTLTIPLWNWGATRSRIKRAELAQKQAEYELTFAQRGVESTLRTAYIEADTARAQLDSLKSSLDLSEESLRLTLLRYQAGEATALEVVDAQSTLALARNAYADGLARYRVAVAALQTMTGRL